ncbi:MFS general substrate transporter [Ceraceosorus guamensis]|uniref:MFS general substrate transporter n=1 Tax=Ceraceosorus guamensis TaxID=1522189 RepID=A0A316VYY6_9BASI|nr:MFS general substrate transporter [Ceraceosorus guamensis]PWN42544.1 MFS general substrate transporter [Ceraceosorus guamensis]
MRGTRNIEHNKELARADHQWWTNEEDRSVLRKLDIRLVPLLFVTYMLAALDRSNIGNAKTAGMNENLGISDPDFQWLLTIFYISYCLFQFQVLAYKIFRPSRWIFFCVIVWGVASTLQATATGWSGLMAARFFLGVSEAGYGTGVALYYSFFYPKQEIGIRFAWFITGGALASCIGGSIAYGIQQAKTSVENWRLLFIIEGIPTVVLAFVLLWLMPDSIATSSFLTPRERLIAEARLFRDLTDRTAAEEVEETAATSQQDGATKSLMTSKITGLRSGIGQKLDTKNLAAAFKDPLSYTNSILIFITNVSYSSVPVYLPTILNGMGYTSIRAQGFSAPPYLAAWVFSLLYVYTAMKLRVCGPFIIPATLAGAAGYLVLALSKDDHTRYGAVYLVVIALFTQIPMLYMFLLNNTPGESRRGAGLVIFGVIGQAGPFLGTRLFPAKQGPYYAKGMFISAGLLFAATAISTATTVMLWQRNRMRDRAEEALEKGTDQLEKTPESLAALSAEEAAERKGWLKRLDASRRGEDSPYCKFRKAHAKRSCDLSDLALCPLRTTDRYTI